MEPEAKKSRTEAVPASTPSAAKATTVYVRCSQFHNRGDLINKFFYQHRSALQMEDWYNPAKPSLFADAPLEVVFVQTSRKPFFLVEWRHPTEQERAQQHKPDTANADDATNEQPDGEAVPHAAAVSSPNHAFAALTNETLATYASRLLALNDTATSAGDLLTFNGEPVIIAAANDGATVEETRHKLHLRDLARKKVADEAKSQSQEAKPKPTVTSFVPRTVRRRN